MSRISLGRMVAVALLVAAPAAADFVALKDGQRLASRGTWKIKGKQLIFTTADGVLRSMPVAEVDFARCQWPSAAVLGVGRPAPLGAQAVGKGEAPRTKAAYDAEKAQVASGEYVELPSSIDPEKDVPVTQEQHYGEDLQNFIRDPNAKRSSGTISAGRSLPAQLYEYSPQLRWLRVQAVALAGENVVRKVESDFDLDAQTKADCHGISEDLAGRQDPGWVAQSDEESCLENVFAGALMAVISGRYNDYMAEQAHRASVTSDQEESNDTPPKPPRR
ncbi:MAG: hypothetical protein U0X73_00560 [Thermoanaerobaculia bacterium]